MKRIPAATFLRKITDPYIYGIKRNGEPQAYARIDTLEAYLNERNYGYKWKDADFLDHCAGKKTLYFYGKNQCHLGKKGDDELLPEECIMPYFDIDVGKSRGIGTPENAAKAMKFLENYFPGIYSEDNRRAFPLIYNDGYDQEEVKTTFSKLERIFNDLLTKHCGIEKFEIMGSFCDICNGGYKTWKVLGYGVLGKLPTQLLERFDEFYCQPIIRMSSLVKLAADTPMPKVEREEVGSTTNIILSKNQLEMVPEVMLQYKNMAYRCMAFRTTDPAGGRKVSPVKFQAAFTILSACHLKPNKNGQLPTARIAFLWQYLYHNGYEEIGHFHGSVWKCLRDTMEDCGYLDMIDERYWFTQDGTPGKAMEWSLKPEFSHDFKQHTHIYMDTVPEFVAFRSRPKLVFQNKLLSDEEMSLLEMQVEAIFQT